MCTNQMTEKQEVKSEKEDVVTKKNRIFITRLHS